MRGLGALLVVISVAGLAGVTLAQEGTGRKGTRNYVPADPSTVTTADQAEARVNTLEGCMASWDASTHISKQAWREICRRELRARAAHSGPATSP